MKFAIVIPTKNRSINLKKSLKHNLKYIKNIPVVIVDASTSFDYNFVDFSNIRHIKASEIGQFNQKIEGVEYVKKTYKSVTHILFLDDDIYLDRSIDKFLKNNYDNIDEDPNQTVINLHVRNFEKNPFLEFFKVYSFRAGLLKSNTYASRVCIGKIKKIEWVLGGSSCWPIKKCPSYKHYYGLPGKAYLEDAFFSSVMKNSVKFYSSERTFVLENDFYKTEQSFREYYDVGQFEMLARRMLCDRFEFYSLRYMELSSLIYSLVLILGYLCLLKFSQIGYPSGILSDVLNYERKAYARRSS